MEICTLSREDLSLLHEFLKTPMPAHFRYFERRTPETAVASHVVTALGLVDGAPVAYGHIDFEERHWLGLCVLESHQRRGFGKQMLAHLLAAAKAHPTIDTLHLTVDADNAVARALYERNGFRTDPATSTASVVRMSLILKPIIRLPVSYGEAVDKLTILDIKREMIRDARRLDVDKEYTAIYTEIAPLLTDSIQYYYGILKEINQSIWDMQDLFRDATDPAVKNDLCTKIIVENDRRFRVKAKINNHFQSALKEQKGYTPRKAFVITHLGMGDMITANGLVRHLSTRYEKVVVVSKKKYAANARDMYSDDSTIEIMEVESDRSISPRCRAPPALLARIKETHDIFLCGCHVLHRAPIIYDLPFSFYADVDLDPSIFWTYSHIPTLPESQRLLALARATAADFVVVHNSSSTGPVFPVEAVESRLLIDRNTTLVINTSTNVYPPEHPFHAAAQAFVMTPLIHYKGVLENASKIIASDSSLYCLALNIVPANPRAEGYYISRGGASYDHIYSAKYQPPPHLQRIRFQQLRL